MGNEKFRDHFRFFGRHQQIDIVHNFFSPPITSRYIHLQRVGMTCEIVS
jgi:hypothetical protein